MARPRREAFSTPQLRQLGDVGGDAPSRVALRRLSGKEAVIVTDVTV
jgi:hypothetical protein